MATEKETLDLHDTGVAQEKSVDTAVQIAHDVDERKYSPFSPSLLKLYAVLLIPYLCGCLNGCVPPNSPTQSPLPTLTGPRHQI